MHIKGKIVSKDVNSILHFKMPNEKQYKKFREGSQRSHDSILIQLQVLIIFPLQLSRLFHRVIFDCISIIKT